MARTKSNNDAALEDAKRSQGWNETRPVIPPQSQPQRSCNDILFAVLFLAAFGATVALAAMYGKDVLDTTDVNTQNKLQTASNFIHESKAKYKYAMRICAAIAGGTLLASLVWTVIMLVCGKMLIW